ncbi:nucleotidyltransferase [Bacillus sp. CECT 9360]|uniref:nucleotidyltransferase n=1 Tax=Bacillus sp. CECT 9360 TaxID=2845821 RepID=UPI001E576629|nr:nucleotidyltransferase [Bacillus sp. CECT 9360]CAH0346875.1 tRNA(Met) cytidine acetate ligase [Bacillus sp. CECT 9360]
MKAVGLVVEYNPFHNGHAYHLKKSKEAADADTVIAVMSGPFLQRGEPSLISKWARTEMALQAGVDLVIELPYPFASQKAEIFARGAISILEALQCDSFCFGSENGQIEPFLSTYQLLEEYQEKYNELIKEHIKEGYSYPRAASLAFGGLSVDDALDLSKPNNILGIEYIRAALSNDFAIKPATIPRIQAEYHDPTLTENSIASATAIRKALFENEKKAEDIDGYVPAASSTILKEYLDQYQLFHSWDLYWPLLKYCILSASADELEQIYEIEEGIQYRIKDAAGQAQNFHEFMTALKTKRYTWTRLQRMCVHILTNTTKAEMFPLQESPSYLRLLGMSPVGRSYLRNIKKKVPIPVVSKLSSFVAKEIEPDIRASRIYALGLSEPYQSRLMKREFEAPILLDNL